MFFSFFAFSFMYHPSLVLRLVWCIRKLWWKR